MVNSPEKERELFYNQLSHITFMCPMRFNKFPFDSHICPLKVGSTSHDDTRMTFGLRCPLPIQKVENNFDDRENIGDDDV